MVTFYPEGNQVAVLWQGPLDRQLRQKAKRGMLNCMADFILMLIFVECS
jgi:hypothetical protein